MKFINNMNKAPLLQHYVVLQFHVVIYKSEGGISLPKSEVIMNLKATLRGIWSTEKKISMAPALRMTRIIKEKLLSFFFLPGPVLRLIWCRAFQ